MKIVFLSQLIFAILVCVDIRSQTPNEKAYLLVRYEETSIADSTDILNINYDVMGLEIGKTKSRFYSISLSESKKAIEEQMKKGGAIDLRSLNFSKNRRGKQTVMYKNYSTNLTTSIEQLGVNKYMFQELTPNINWQIQSDTMRILNYRSQKAICQFRGRIYEAWFTSEINISEGPWKFTGLPGLILKVADSKNHFNFECKRIEKVNTDIENPNEKAQKVSKFQFLDLNKQYLEDPTPFMNNGRSSFTLDSPPSNLPKRPYNPMELTEK